MTLVIGGCRSGKSGHALRLAETLSERNRVFIATCRPMDEEMRQRVAKHQRERDPSWRVVEDVSDLGEAIRQAACPDGVVLVDCLTLWAADLLWSGSDMEAALDRLMEGMRASSGPVVLVSGEVGLGMVPENAMARAYRDAVGLINQRVAALADRVVWMVAGIPVVIQDRSQKA
uniref:Adenosylcobinamide kinase n=1 Tax=Desulfatirhabdium butyrativorans TaxID=340467 RepID=A0A7C4RSZ9_9BACT